MCARTSQWCVCVGVCACVCGVGYMCECMCVRARLSGVCVCVCVSVHVRRVVRANAHDSSHPSRNEVTLIKIRNELTLESMISKERTNTHTHTHTHTAAVSQKKTLTKTALLARSIYTLQLTACVQRVVKAFHDSCAARSMMETRVTPHTTTTTTTTSINSLFRHNWALSRTNLKYFVLIPTCVTVRPMGGGSVLIIP